MKRKPILAPGKQGGNAGRRLSASELDDERTLTDIVEQWWDEHPHHDSQAKLALVRMFAEEREKYARRELSDEKTSLRHAIEELGVRVVVHALAFSHADTRHDASEMQDASFWSHAEEEEEAEL